jgi:diaminopimelate epimerase
MMTLAFNKYQGAGNDFIIIDNRNDVFNPQNDILIKNLCDRRFGIGADGLILINKMPEYDFRMVYFNSDGFEGTMCGNGGRCAADFAIRSGIAGKKLRFIATDGIHDAISEEEVIRLKMNDVNETRSVAGNYFINTGSPHYVIFTDGLNNLDVYNEGKKIRWSKDFQPGGTNVNFVECEDGGIYVRTFERGVEDETLSCGTGVTASAIASVLTGHFVSGPVNVRTKGGNLKVEFDIKEDKIKNIWLCGPATFVFEGKINI